MVDNNGSEEEHHLTPEEMAILAARANLEQIRSVLSKNPEAKQSEPEDNDVEEFFQLRAVSGAGLEEAKYLGNYDEILGMLGFRNAVLRGWVGRTVFRDLIASRKFGERSYYAMSAFLRTVYESMKGLDADGYAFLAETVRILSEDQINTVLTGSDEEIGRMMCGIFGGEGVAPEMQEMVAIKLKAERMNAEIANNAALVIVGEGFAQNYECALEAFWQITSELAKVGGAILGPQVLGNDFRKKLQNEVTMIAGLVDKNALRGDLQDKVGYIVGILHDGMKEAFADKVATMAEKTDSDNSSSTTEPVERDREEELDESMEITLDDFIPPDLAGQLGGDASKQALETGEEIIELLKNIKIMGGNQDIEQGVGAGDFDDDEEEEERDLESELGLEEEFEEYYSVSINGKHQEQIKKIELLAAIQHQQSVVFKNQQEFGNFTKHNPKLAGNVRFSKPHQQRSQKQDEQGKNQNMPEVGGEENSQQPQQQQKASQEQARQQQDRAARAARRAARDAERRQREQRGKQQRQSLGQRIASYFKRDKGDNDKDKKPKQEKPKEVKAPSANLRDDKIFEKAGGKKNEGYMDVSAMREMERKIAERQKALRQQKKTQAKPKSGVIKDVKEVSPLDRNSAAKNIISDRNKQR